MLIKPKREEHRWKLKIWTRENRPHKNMVNLGKSTTHHGPYCPDYKSVSAIQISNMDPDP